MLARAAFASFALSLVAAACSTPAPRGGFGTEVADGGAADAGDGGPGTGFGANTVDATAPVGEAEVFGHSKDTLYRLDPDTKAVTTIGTLDGCEGALIDLAADRSGNLVGCTLKALYRVDRESGACTKVADGTFPTSLSFVPAGTLDDTREVLVGYEDDTYVRIDPATGDKATIETIDGDLISSGDVVSVVNGPTYLTVKPRDPKNYKGPCSDNDCLVEVDPKTGMVKKSWGPIGHKDVFGLAYWGGKVYGFDKQGSLFEIAFANGTVETTTIPIPDAPDGLSFYGAGSTTSAPTGPR